MKSSVLAAICSVLLVAGSSAQHQPTTVIFGATLIDGTGAPPMPNAIIIIRADRIADVGTSSTVSIPTGARVIDARGKFLLPGLIDTHVHLEAVGLSDIGEIPPEWSTPGKIRDLAVINARLDLIAGFTTVRDLGSTAVVLSVRDDIDSGRLPGPRIVAAGMQLVRVSTDAPAASMFLEYEGRDSAHAKVRYLASMGADVIKIRLTHMRPVPSLEEVRAIVEEAHGLGIRATVHTDVPADDLVALAIDAGADGIEHNAPLRSQDSHVLARMARLRMSLMAGAGAFFVQRLDTTRAIGVFDRAQARLLPEEVLAALRAGIDSLHRQTDHMKESGWNAAHRQESFIAEVQRARQAGVLLVFGTDCGAYGMIHGEQYKALYGESNMGSSAMDVILMATRDAAKALGKAHELGTIEGGEFADMIIIDADPLTDLRNLRQIFRVVKGGGIYDPAELSSAPKH